MSVIIDLGKRFAAAFGLLSGNNLPNAAVVNNAGPDYGLSSYLPLSADFEDLIMEYDGNRLNFAAMLSQSDLDIANILAPPPLIGFSRRKKHIETQMNGSDNVVVERWGTRPWEIRMRGLLIDIKERHYPESRVSEIARLFKYNGIVEVAGTQFYDKDISAIYFKEIEINGVQGFQDTVQYTLTASSIAPVGFTLLNP